MSEDNQDKEKKVALNQFNIDGVHYFSCISLNNLLYNLLDERKLDRDKVLSYMVAMLSDASIDSNATPVEQKKEGV